jgi:hypothetical protein
MNEIKYLFNWPTAIKLTKVCRPRKGGDPIFPWLLASVRDGFPPLRE